MPPIEPPSTSHSSRTSSIQSEGYAPHARQSDTRQLHPNDAFHAHSPPRSRPIVRSDAVTVATVGVNNAQKKRDKRHGRSSSRRPRPFKKVLWVKQSYPDNYTDEETFLDHLQRNPRLRPYEFWPLVADSTIIVQHVCSVIIFVCCFTGIFQERVSPATVVSWATTGTCLGWILRDYWQSRDESNARAARHAELSESLLADHEDKHVDASHAGMPDYTPTVPGLSSAAQSRVHSRNPSVTSTGVPYAAPSQIPAVTDAINGTITPSRYITPYNSKGSMLSPRMLERLTTVKSAILIYFSLLGLSPILKSLTKSTSSDSIWALSSWLMCINVFTFDYGAGPEVKFPASLSTNAALMASTVLASRLPSTTHVFSLTLFSIEVFGLFPVFRRHLKHHSWTLHVWLTIFLIVLASGGLSMVISGGGWGYAFLGVILGGIVTCLSMGVTSWWLIGLQRYKNEIHGPWDPARPVIRGHWE